jgi:zinc transporter ZupT
VLGWVFLRGASVLWLDAIVAHVGGGFLFLAAHAVLGEIFRHHKALVLVNFSAGFLSIGALTLALRFH